MNFARTFVMIWLILVVTAQQAAAEGPQTFIRSFVDRAVVLTTKETLSAVDRRRQFGELVNASVDLEYIGPSLIGPYWTLASPRQRRALIEAVTYLVPASYMDHLHLYIGQAIVIDGHRQEGTRSVVSSRIVSFDGRADVPIDWHVDRRGGRLRIVDICVDGTSVNEQLRQEYLSVIRRSGGQVDALVDWLDRQLAIGLNVEN